MILYTIPDGAAGARDAVTHRERWLASGQRVLVDLPGSGGQGAHRWPVFCRVSAARKPWVTLLHGAPTSSWDYARLAPLLDGQVSTLAFDFLGFGASDKPDIAYSIPAQADLTEAVWARHHLPSTWVVAHGYGALVALELLARQARARLAVPLLGLVLLNGPLYGPRSSVPLGLRLLQAPVLGAALSPLATRGAFFSTMRRLFRSPGEPSDELLAQHWIALEERGGRRVLRSLLHDGRDLAAHHERWAWALDAEVCPAHFVWGLDDPLDGPLASEIQRRRPRAPFLGLPQVGHFPHVEDPVTVADAVLGAALGERRGG